MATEYSGGYMSRMLRVDLSRRVLTEEETDPERAEKYLGGVGLGSAILYDEVPGGVEPFDPENRLIFMSGPFSGTAIPGSGTYSVVTRGPLTGLAAGAQANGWFGARLKFAGYDGLIIQGASSNPVYLLVDNGKVEIRDGSQLTGLDSIETQNRLKKEPGLKNASVACIGPAGENRVRFASICSDRGHIASTNGVGGVMGSKNLKAVVVNGDAKIPVADPERFSEIAREWITETRSSAIGETVDKLGTAGFFSAAAVTGWLPVKNMTTDLFKDHPRFNGDAIRASVKSTRKPCHACPLHHCNDIEITEGPHEGLITDEPEYEGLAGFGPLIGNNDPWLAVKLCDQVDRLGMDLKEFTFTIALAMECYEQGLIDKKDTGGIELTWGNGTAVGDLLNLTAEKQGFGADLAEGVCRFAKKIGPEAVNRAVYTHKGLAPHVHDPRGLWGFLFGQAISNMGSIEGWHTLELLPEPDLGYDQPIPKYEDPNALVIGQEKLARKYYFVDSIGTCYFTSAVPISLMVKALNALTGWTFSADDLLRLGHRVRTTLRQFNIRHGWTRADDSLSQRLLAPSPDGPNKGIAIAGVYEKMVDVHYARVGWDKTGRPLPETLNRLGINA